MSDGSKFAVCNSEAAKFINYCGGVTWGQNIFLLDSGYLGMGPKSGRPGDEIWIIAGCPFPMALRRRRKDDFEFVVLGRVHVHGIMHGEASGGDGAWQQVTLV